MTFILNHVYIVYKCSPLFKDRQTGLVSAKQASPSFFIWGLGIGHCKLRITNYELQVMPEFDAIIIGSGIGGLVTATQLAAKGAKVVVLERYIIPGGSAGYFERQGYRFDVGASMIFGFGQQGTTNLLTRALAAVGESIETIPDRVQIHYHYRMG